MKCFTAPLNISLFLLLGGPADEEVLDIQA